MVRAAGLDILRIISKNQFIVVDGDLVIPTEIPTFLRSYVAPSTAVALAVACNRTKHEHFPFHDAAKLVLSCDRPDPETRMAQHFLLSAAARTLSLRQVMRMEESEAWQAFRKVRWPDTDGEPVCPRCDCPSCWECPRPNGAPRSRCKACGYDFSPTSGTLFAHHKLPIRDYLAAIAIFCNEVKGKSSLALSRDLRVQYKTAFVLGHKIREAMGAARKRERIGGAGRIAEVDGAWFGGHIRPENRKADRKDRRLSENRNDKRQCVVLICERPAPGAMPAGRLPP
jgi:transposase-like protein